MSNTVQTEVNTLTSAENKPEMISDWRFDDIAVETPVALVYNYISHAVMMVSPTDLKDFALGFSLTEDIIQNPDEVSHIHIQKGNNGITVRLQISDERFDELRDRRRNMVGRTGCGLCGTETLKQAIRPIPEVKPPELTDNVIQKALGDLKKHQPLQNMTGATHAAAWCDLAGEIQLVREDVGRHNALDKLIGALVKMEDFVAGEGFVVISSRASYEMVFKCCKAGIGALVAVSAPTSLAIEQAQQAGLMLVGFGRSGRHVIYHHPEHNTVLESTRTAV